jgi:lipoyl(octanoyl) transferase
MVMQDAIKAEISLDNGVAVRRDYAQVSYRDALEFQTAQ